VQLITIGLYFKCFAIIFAKDDFPHPLGPDRSRIVEEFVVSSLFNLKFF